MDRFEEQRSNDTEKCLTLFIKSGKNYGMFSKDIKRNENFIIEEATEYLAPGIERTSITPNGMEFISEEWMAQIGYWIIKEIRTSLFKEYGPF
ncbi:hypothetical protein HNY73_001852 [Argiope bruennichi]|uniref:Uncharacterized protein n=1 Tax=Argiope bruennichi TaxID=94029 RepID=A0A8T0FY97_ARGBR|nr:hypothetical protein HNY73_001852 [Argiope bruennichi]